MNDETTTSGTAEPLHRQLSAFGVWLLVINGIVGGGIFGLPAEATRLAGGFSPWIFVLCAAFMLPVMLSFAELASHFEGTGGPVRYARAAFGRFAGFQAGWASYVARLTAFSANATLLVGATGYFIPGLDAPGPRLAMLFMICAGLCAITIVGTRNAIGSLGLLTFLKFLALTALVVGGLQAGPDAIGRALTTPLPEHADVGAAIFLVFYAYVGFESGLVPAGEAKDPRRDMPRALFWAIGVVAILYFALQTVSLAVVPDLAHSRRPLVDAGSALFGPVGAVIVMAGLAASVGGNLAGILFSTSRITYAMALDGALPTQFARVSVRFGSPAFSIVVFGMAAFLLAAGGSFVWLAGLSVLARVLIYLGCIAALPVLRRYPAHGAALLRLPGGLLIPAVAAFVCLGLLTQVKAADWLATAALLGAGSVLYAIAEMRRAR